MKTKKKYKKLVKQIQKELAAKEGLLQPAGFTCNKKPMHRGEFYIGDNDELLYNISCLLKTCVLALEGDAIFSLSAFSGPNPKANVVVALEFIINLLPRQQMIALDAISDLLAEAEFKKE